MNTKTKEKRMDEIIHYLKSLEINSKRFINLLNTKNLNMISIIDEALTHSSANKKINHEKLYRYDHKYDYFILIEYNYKKTIINKGSAIFIHLTKNYKPTAGCIAVSKKDFLILAKLIRKNTKILID